MRTPGVNSVERPAEPLGDGAGDRPDLALERFVEDERAAGDARDELDGAVVVRRPETARHEAEIGREALLEGALEILHAVTDDRDARRIEPEANDLGREERAVAVLPIAADELGARDDDRRLRAAQDVARVILRAVTANVVPAGRSTRFPFTRTTTLSGSASASCSDRPVEGLPLTLLERAAVEELPGARRQANLHPRASLARAYGQAGGSVGTRRRPRSRILAQPGPGPSRSRARRISTLR